MSIDRDQTTWCLDRSGPAVVLVRRVVDGAPLFSEALPIPRIEIPPQRETLEYGFDSLWLSYSGWPMGVLRIDPESLVIQARVDVDTGQFSRSQGSQGEITAGQTAIWALSNGVLSRIDPSSNTINLQVETGGLSIAASPGVVWVAGFHSVMKIDSETLNVEQTFSAPEGMHISHRASWGRRTQRLTVSGQTVRVPLAVTRKGFLSCASNCPQEFIGRLDHASGTIIVDPASDDRPDITR